MDFSKVSDTLNQKVFFGKLEPYDLDPESSSFFAKLPYQMIPTLMNR